MLIKDSKQDPMGQAMLAYLHGDQRAVVQVYSDIAVDDVIPARYLFRSFSAMPAWERMALEQCRGDVLDVGAGAGIHSLWLQHQGYLVQAMDVSPGAVEVMQARGVKKALHEDIYTYQGPPVDTLLLLMNGIGLVGDLHGLNQFLDQAKGWLKPGGQILLDSSDISYLYESEELSLTLPEGRYHGIIRYQMTFGAIQGEAFDWLYLDYPKLVQHATHHGYSCSCLHKGPHYEYLARLIPKEPIA